MDNTRQENRRNLIVKLLEVYGTRVRHRGQWRIHEKLRQMFHVHLDGNFEVDRGGLRWVLTPNDPVQADIFWLGTKNKAETHHILHFLQPGWTVLDLGANIGYYSLITARHLNRNCAVYAFEPCSTTFDRLRENIRLNGMEACVEPVQMAVSDHRGRGTLTAQPVHSGENFVTTADSGNVPLISVDQFCEERKIQRVDFIKMDVEGFEGQALNGARAMIARSAPMLVVEINEKTLRRSGWSSDRLVGLLRELGYSLFVAHRTCLVELQRLPNLGEYINAFCLAPKHLSTETVRRSLG